MNSIWSLFIVVCFAFCGMADCPAIVKKLEADDKMQKTGRLTEVRKIRTKWSDDTRNPDGKRYEYKSDKLPSEFSPPAGAKADWRPSSKVKANDTISFIYPFAKKDMDAFFCSSDNGDVRLYVWEDEKGLRVSIDTGETGKGKKATAKVTWKVLEINGREHRWSMDVVFE